MVTHPWSSAGCAPRRMTDARCAVDHAVVLCTRSHSTRIDAGTSAFATDNTLAMKLDLKSLQMSPALREQVGRTVAAQVGQAPLGKPAQDDSCFAPVPSQAVAAELESLRASILAAVGKKTLEELAQVGIGECTQATSDPVDALVLFSLVLALRVHCPPCEGPKGCGPKPPRAEKLPKLGVVAKAGVFEEPAPPPTLRDPLILIFKNVAPSTEDSPTQIYMINKSNLRDRTPILLPADLGKAKNGEYSLILGDEWMVQHGIRPSQTVSFYQTKGKASKLAPSDATTVSVNAKGPGLINTPALPPGDRVGEVTVREQFRKFLDVVPAPVEPMNLSHVLEGGMFTAYASAKGPATEPLARVVVQNLRTGERGPMTIVDEADQFTSAVAADRGDPMLIRIFDHSRAVDDPAYERRLTVIAGESGPAMLAGNPMLGIDAPPALRLGRLELGGKGCQDLLGKLAATPGSVISARRIGLDGKAGPVATTIAGAEGSFRLPMPFEVHAGDLFDLRVENPFVSGPNRAEVQTRAVAAVRLEVGADGGFNVVSSSGAVGTRGTKEGDAPVAALSNVDTLESGEPRFHRLRPTILDFGLRFEPYNPNTGNGASMSVRSDGRAPPQAHVRWDAEKTEVEVVVSQTVPGGWPEPDKDHCPHVGFGTYGGTNWGFNNPQVNPLRHAVVGRAAGERVPVRFVHEDGSVFARGELAVETKEEGTGSGAGGMQQTRYAKLDLASLQKVGG